MSSSAVIDTIAQILDLSGRLSDTVYEIKHASSQQGVTAKEEEAKQIMWALQALTQNVGRDVKAAVEKRRIELRNA